MITPQYCEMMALYNRWQNEALFQRCEALSVEQLAGDRGLFFGSILRTLNHILHVDQTIHGMIHGRPRPPHFEPNTMLYTHFSDLKAARFRFDEQLVQESRTMVPAWLDEEFEFWSDRLQRRRRLPRSFYYVQLFNHQTHHRSQITAELHKLGIDYGNTDLPMNPYWEY